MKDIVQCSCLGKYGRFGNQLIQYLYAKTYAQKYNFQLQIPNDWVGRKIFDIKQNGISRILPKTQCDLIPYGKSNIDLFGYFQCKQFTSQMSVIKMRNMLIFKDLWIKQFKKQQQFYIACHIRRGDYLKYSNKYCIISQKSYSDACKQFGLDMDKVQYSTEQNPRNNKLAQQHGIGFLADFMFLMNSDVLLRSNSTFSLMAGVLSSGKIYAPLVQNRTGQNDVKFVLGNYPKTVNDKYVDDFNFKD